MPRTREQARAYNQKYYAANRERLVENQRKYNEANRESVNASSMRTYFKNREAVRVRKRAKYVENCEEVKTRQREYNANESASGRSRNRMLLKLYGITLEQFNEMGQKQGWRCLICAEYKKGKGPVGCLHVDHCHETGKVRGLLCSDCNRAIGQLCDNPMIIESAAAYLWTHKDPDGSRRAGPNFGDYVFPEYDTLAP